MCPGSDDRCLQSLVPDTGVSRHQAKFYSKKHGCLFAQVPSYIALYAGAAHLTSLLLEPHISIFFSQD